MEALKIIIPIALALLALLTISSNKILGNELHKGGKALITSVLAVLFAVSWFIWPGRPTLNSVAKIGTTSKDVTSFPKDVPSSKLMFAISGSSVINDSLSVALVIAYMETLNCKDITVIVTGKKEKSIIGTLNNEKIRFDIGSPGTKDGFLALKDKKADICMASAQGGEEFRSTTSENVIGLDGIAVVTNIRNPIEGLYKEEIQKIYSGEVNNWSQVRGSKLNTPIKIYRMGDKTGIYKLFKEMIMDNKDIAADAFDKSNEMVESIGNDANSIGFVSYTFVAKNTQIKEVPIGDTKGLPTITPNALTISSERYPLCRRLFMYLPNKEANVETFGFTKFVKSDAGQKIVGSVGFVNLTVNTDNTVINISTDPPSYRNLKENYRKVNSEFRFAFGNEDLDSRGLDDIDRISSNPEYLNKKIVLVGFTDNIGSDEANITLSKKRASNVAKKLYDKGLSVSDQIGMGKLRPTRDNSTAQGRDFNRRVELWIEK